MIFNILFSSITFLILIVATSTSAYEFVTCPDDNKIYPEGTVCELTDDDLMEEEEREDEREHAKESKER